MVSAIVTEEKIFESKQNIRTDFTSVRKATEAVEVISSARVLSTGEKIEISGTSAYIHFHSNQILRVVLGKNGQSVLFDTNILTIASPFDTISFENLQDSEADLYLVYS